jgi:uncharacterized protein YqfA (UPF0365 family)
MSAKTPARLLAEHLFRRLSPAKTDEANITEIEHAFQDVLDQWQGRLDQLRAEADKDLAQAIDEERRKHYATLDELNALKEKLRDLRVRRGASPAHRSASE